MAPRRAPCTPSRRSRRSRRRHAHNRAPPACPREPDPDQGNRDRPDRAASRTGARGSWKRRACGCRAAPRRRAPAGRRIPRSLRRERAQVNGLERRNRAVAHRARDRARVRIAGEDPHLGRTAPREVPFGYRRCSRLPTQGFVRCRRSYAKQPRRAGPPRRQANRQSDMHRAGSRSSPRSGRAPALSPAETRRLSRQPTRARAAQALGDRVLVEYVEIAGELLALSLPTGASPSTSWKPRRSPRSSNGCGSGLAASPGNAKRRRASRRARKRRCGSRSTRPHPYPATALRRSETRRSSSSRPAPCTRSRGEGSRRCAAGPLWSPRRSRPGSICTLRHALGDGGPCSLRARGCATPGPRDADLAELHPGATVLSRSCRDGRRYARDPRWCGIGPSGVPRQLPLRQSALLLARACRRAAQRLRAAGAPPGTRGRGALRLRSRCFGHSSRRRAARVCVGPARDGYEDDRRKRRAGARCGSAATDARVPSRPRATASCLLLRWHAPRLAWRWPASSASAAGSRRISWPLRRLFRLANATRRRKTRR